MKINSIKRITYGAFIFGALIMLLAMILPILSDYITVFMCIGGAMGICGMIFCINSLRFSVCTKCREFVNFRELTTKRCPLCGDKFS